jgi:uncharacterized protein (DUF1330 family)
MSVKISDLPAKGSAIDPTDLLEIAEVSGAIYVSKRVTGQDIIDAAGGGSQDLQQVTGNGNTTDIDIIVTDGNDSSQISTQGIVVTNGISGTYSAINYDGNIVLKAGSQTSSLANTNVTNPGVVLEFPDKASGSYTIATTADIPSSQDLQQVTDIGATTTNAITVTTGSSEITTITGIDIKVENTLADTHATLSDTGTLALKTGAEESALQNTAVTNPGVILEFPDKATGSYTIATTSDIPSVSGFVPYTGATSDVDLGTFHLDAAKGTFTHNGSTDTLTANHTSGSGIGLLITKGGNNEGLKVNKTSGSGNAATIIGTLEATTLVKTGGLATEFLMADGSTSLGGGGGITVGTTAVTSGTDGRVFFQAGGVVQQDANFTFDNTLKRLTLKAVGALVTDIPFLIQDSAGTGNLAYINGVGDVALSSATITAGTGGNGTAIAIGAGAVTNTAFTMYPIAIGRNSASNGNSIAIGNGASTGTGQSNTSSLVIGLNSTSPSTYGNNIAIGNTISHTNSANNILIGDNLAFGGNGKNTSGIALGRFFGATSFLSSGAYAIGSGVSVASPALLNITDSFSVYFRNTERSFFVNKNTNIVMRSVSALTAGTHYETTATNTLTIHNGTAPITNIADAFQQYSADITAGNAAPHFRTENGSVIKLYKETTAVTASTLVSNLGLPITDTDTFDGYTLKQIVKALRNQGLLA